MSNDNMYDQHLSRNEANHAPLSPLAFIERTAEVYPERLAIVHGDLRQTWAQTYARCRRLASGLRPGSAFDRITSTVSLVFVAVPVFWFGLLLIILFAVTWRLLPAGGMNTAGQEGNLGDLLRHLILPAVVLSAASIAEILRYTRSSTRTVSTQDYVRTARAKGVG